MTNAATQGVNAVMISNNAGDQIEPSVKSAVDAGVKVVSWDSPIPSGEGESLFVAQVDFDETGTVMADMALEILGADGGKFAILSASPDAANQNAWIAAMKEALKDSKYPSSSSSTPSTATTSRRSPTTRRSRWSTRTRT